MFEIFVVIGIVLLTIVLSCLCVDMHKLKRDLKSCRRERLRNSMGGRTSESYPGFSEAEYWEEARREAEDELESGPAENVIEAEPVKNERKRILSLRPDEEQVLRDILAEFLG